MIPLNPKMNDEKKETSDRKKVNEKQVVVEKEFEEKLEGEKNDDLVEDEVRGYTLYQLMDKNLPQSRIEKQILIEPSAELPDYIKPSYPILKKKPKKEMEVGQFKNFIDMLPKIQVNIPFVKLSNICMFMLNS